MSVLFNNIQEEIEKTCYEHLKENCFEPNLIIDFSREGYYQARSDREYHRYFDMKLPPKKIFGYSFTINNEQQKLFIVRINDNRNQS